MRYLFYIRQIYVFICIVLGQTACKPVSGLMDIHKLESGDLIFVEARTEKLSGAINRVTQKSAKENFDHVGLIEVSGDTVFVLHATSGKGSVREPLVAFYEENIRNEQQMVLYRLVHLKKEQTKQIITKAKTMLGKPYNESYILDENSFYCSDFVERAFRDQAVFEHIPMNFKNLKTGEIDNFWKDFYARKKLEVPQGYPGTNPNQLASSPQLVRKGVLLLK